MFDIPLLINLFISLIELKNIVKTSNKTTHRVFLTTFCVRYSHAVLFLRNEMPYSLLKIQKNMSFRGYSVLNRTMRGKNPQLPF